MSRTVTLRLPDEVYRLFDRCAKADHRPISNLIQTAAVRHLEEAALVSPAEMREIAGNGPLVRKLRRGSTAARERRGRMVG